MTTLSRAYTTSSIDYGRQPKCQLVTQQVQYLGFVTEPPRVGAGPDKVATVRKWPRGLRNRKQLRGVLGLVGYYRRLVPNFNKWAHPYELLPDDSDTRRLPKDPRAVQQLKNALAADTFIRILDPDNPATSKTDASKETAGAVLEQEGNPVAFESRKLGSSEQFLPA